MTALTAAQLARLIDFPLHRPDATAKDVEQHCAIAREHHFAAVAVNSSYVVHARHFLEDSDVKVVAAIGYPLGGVDGDTKRYETEVAVDNGAQEIDVVMNIGRLKDGDDKYILRELRDVAEAADERFDLVPIFTDELMFITSPMHPWVKDGVAPRAEIARQNLIVYRKSSQTFRAVDDYFRTEDIVLNTIIELGSMEAIKELVKLGLGVSIAAPWVVQRELEDGSLRAIPLGRRKLKRSWAVVHWRGRRLTLAEETFVGLCRSAVESLPRTWEQSAASEAEANGRPFSVVQPAVGT